jgi:hypothetical protein
MLLAKVRGGEEMTASHGLLQLVAQCPVYAPVWTYANCCYP